MEKQIINKLCEEKMLDFEDFKQLLITENNETICYLAKKARAATDSIYGNEIYIRGLIEFTNYCKNNCLYCGIRSENKNAQRYRLSVEQIMSCCETGYELGFRTFVLQGGEDRFFDDARICEIVYKIKSKFSDCAVTLSIGEKSKQSYKAYFDAGADRYLLRHETANENHYKKLHSIEMSPDNRKKCLYNLKEIGYQTGCGFMVGSPFQSLENLYEDLCFIKELRPQMVGIGPFIPHRDTPFRANQAGSMDKTLRLLSIIRLIQPNVLLPATTALGTIHPSGRELGIKHGANVVMPNLSPITVREKYSLYDNKICTGDEAAECKNDLTKRIEAIGYKIAVTKGDFREGE